MVYDPPIKIFIFVDFIVFLSSMDYKLIMPMPFSAKTLHNLIENCLFEIGFEPLSLLKHNCSIQNGNLGVTDFI